jgi:hypothetical protein
MTQNEKYMVVKSKWGQCMITGLIHILKFVTFVFFTVLLCCLFTYGTQIVNVNLNSNGTPITFWIVENKQETRKFWGFKIKNHFVNKHT